MERGVQLASHRCALLPRRTMKASHGVAEQQTLGLCRLAHKGRMQRGRCAPAQRHVHQSDTLRCAGPLLARSTPGWSPRP